MSDKGVLEHSINPLSLINKITYNDIPIKLDRTEKMVLLSLVNHNNWKTGICNPSIKTIQNEWFYKSDREVIEALRRLNKKNFFTKQTIKRRNYYHLNIGLLLNDYPQNVGNIQNEGNIQNVGDNNPQNVGDGYPQNVGTNNEITIKEQLNIYTSSSEEEDSKKYVNEIDKKLESDLLNKIKSKYSKELIKDELDKLKDKGLSELDLLKELDKNLKANKKELENNKTKNKSKDKKYLEDSKEYKLSVLLRDLILERDNNSRCKNANMQSWSKHIDLLHRKDNRSYKDIESVIKWCQQDNFWKTNILSTQKLREKFDTLYQKSSISTKEILKRPQFDDEGIRI